MKKLRRVILFPIAFAAVLTILVVAYLYDGRDHMNRVLDGLVNA